MERKSVLITGGAGFIGSHLVDRLVKEGHEILVLDNLTSGSLENLSYHIKGKSIRFENLDISKDKIGHCFRGIDVVYHFAANSRVNAPGDLDSFYYQNVHATRMVLDAAVRNDVETIFFPSTSTVYGEANRFPTSETDPTNPISVYGKTKLAAELIVSCYSEERGIRSIICRLANVVGPRGHGVINDFIRKLREDPKRLNILGDGNQTKSYIHIHDFIDSASLLVNSGKSGIFNVGSSDQISVREIARIVSEEMQIDPEFDFEDKDRGWKGDVPKMLLDITKLRDIGWDCRYNSEQAVRKCMEEILIKQQGNNK